MKHIKSERRQSLVELAISIVILVYLLSGAVEFGIAFFQYVQLRDAAQEGALYGSMNPSATALIEARVRGASNSPIDLGITDPTDPGYASVQTTIIGPACEGNAINVSVTYNHVVFMPFMSTFVGNTIPLNATVTDTILSPVCPP